MKILAGEGEASVVFSSLCSLARGGAGRSFQSKESTFICFIETDIYSQGKWSIFIFGSLTPDRQLGGNKERSTA